MGKKERYSVRWEDGTVRTVSAQSHRGARKAFIDDYEPPSGGTIVVWPQSNASDKQTFRT